MFYLIRHGETDYSNNGNWIYRGFGENFAPLTKKGIEQILNTSQDKRLSDAEIIVTSPYTRTMETAAILSKQLQIDIVVEPELFEWVADKDYVYQPCNIAEKRCKEFNDLNGEYPEGEEKPWENNVMLKARLIKTLKHYADYKKVIVVCHGMLIHSVYNDHWTLNGEIIEYIL